MRVIAWLVILSTAMSMVGCGSYVLRGRVVEGGTQSVSVVDINDAMIRDAQRIKGVSGATVSLVRDPEQLNRTVVASSTSNSDGYFVLPVRAFGAGWMEEQWEIDARAFGHLPSSRVVELPASTDGLAVLIIMQEGQAPNSVDDQDPMQLYERYK